MLKRVLSVFNLLL